MNNIIKIKRISYSTIPLKKPSINIKIRTNKKRNITLADILREITYLRYKNFEKISNISYNDQILLNKPKSSGKKYRYLDGQLNYKSQEKNNTFNFSNNINSSSLSRNKKPFWNYSYYFNPSIEKKRSFNNINKCNISQKKMKIKDIINTKNPYMMDMDDWLKPRMIKILEKNSLIEGEVMKKPWKFFQKIDNI